MITAERTAGTFEMVPSWDGHWIMRGQYGQQHYTGIIDGRGEMSMRGGDEKGERGRKEKERKKARKV